MDCGAGFVAKICFIFYFLFVNFLFLFFISGGLEVRVTSR